MHILCLETNNQHILIIDAIELTYRINLVLSVKKNKIDYGFVSQKGIK